MTDAVKALLRSRKTWTAIGTGITVGATKALPFLAPFFGWTPDQVAQLTVAAGDLANLITALGGLVIIAIGGEDMAAKVSLPPPAVPPTINPKPAGD